MSTARLLRLSRCDAARRPGQAEAEPAAFAAEARLPLPLRLGAARQAEGRELPRAPPEFQPSCRRDGAGDGAAVPGLELLQAEEVPAVLGALLAAAGGGARRAGRGPGRAAEGRGSLPVAAAGETRCDLPLENRCWAALPPGEGPPPEPVCDRLRRGRGTSISAGRGSASRRAAQFSPQATGGGDAVSDVPCSMPSRSQQGVGL